MKDLYSIHLHKHVNRCLEAPYWISKGTKKNEVISCPFIELIE